MFNKPLYILAKDNELPEYQFMDSSTLDWIMKNEPNFEDIKTIRIDPSLIIDKYIKRYMPKIEWFENKKIVSSIHGMRHALRCIALAGILFEDNQLSTNVDELCVVSALHDIRRIDDQEILGHAERAVIWTKEHIELISKKFQCDIDGFPLSNLSKAILYHDKIDYPTSISDSLVELIDHFKMLDALDRYRQPKIKWWLNDDYLKIKPSPVIKKMAFELVVKSEGYSLSGVDDEESIYKALYDIL